jgi:hypothetical protein
MADISKWWIWFDGLRDAAIETDNGKRLHAAGFDLTHTGGGCTAWERAIVGTEYVLWITDGNSGHELTQEAIDYYGDSWLLGAHHLMEGYYTDCLMTCSVDVLIRMADQLDRDVKAGTVTFHQ